MDLSELTEDIIIEILLKTPAKDLVICKTVCKLWYSIISDSKFVNAHLSRSQRQIILASAFYWRQEEVMSIKIDGKNMNIDKFNLYNVFPDEKTVSLLAGCNGLLLLQGHPSCDFYICNLVTHEYTRIPRPKKPRLNLMVPFELRCQWGFYYDSSVERYRLFAIWEKHVIMLTSGDKQWNYLTIPKLEDWQLTSPVFAERELHWLARHNNEHNENIHDRYICSLDVGNMGFTMIKLPICDAERDFIFLSCDENKNKGSLCIATVFQDHVDIWGLADKSNINPWTKKISINLKFLSNIPDFWDKMCIIGIKDDIDSNDDITLKIFVHQGDELLYHDLKRRESKQIANIRNEFCISRPFQFHVDSLVSWHPTKVMAQRRKGTDATYKRTTTREAGSTANNYIELRNKKKIPRRCY